MSAEQPKRLIIGMCGKSSARCARFFAPHFRAIGVVDGNRFGPERGDLLGRKAVGEEKIALVVELPDLLFRKAHDLFPPVLQ